MSYFHIYGSNSAYYIGYREYTTRENDLKTAYVASQDGHQAPYPEVASQLLGSWNVFMVS